MSNKTEHNKHGIPIRHVSHHKGENEVLYPAGLRFSVHGVERNDDSFTIHVTEAPDQDLYEKYRGKKVKESYAPVRKVTL